MSSVVSSPPVSHPLRSPLPATAPVIDLGRDRGFESIGDFAGFSVVEAAGRVGYERLSKDRALRGINVAIQRGEIDDYAAETGDPISRHFCDNDVSASGFGTKPRDEYIDLIGYIMRGLVREIIVTEVPRLCRQVEEALELIRLSKTTALACVTTTDGMTYDLRTPRGKKAFREAVSDAEFESDQTSTRQHRRSNKLAEAGAVHGGQKAYGYEGAVYEELTTPDGERVRGRLLNPGRVGMEIVEEEAAIRREGMQRIIAGEREIDLVRDFNTRDIPAPEGGRWRTSHLKRLLCNKRGVAFDEFPGKGTRVHKGKEYRGIWEAIVSKEDYELLVAELKMRASKRKQDGTVTPREYLLSGLVFCTHEGHGPMYGRGRTLRTGVYQRRYGCASQDHYGEKVYGAKTFRGAEPIERLVSEAVLTALDSPQVMAALAPQEDRARLQELVQLHTKQKLHAQQLVADYGAGVLDKEELIIAKEAARQALDATEAELGKLQRHRTAVSVPKGKTLREVFETASMGWQRQVIELVVERIVIHPSTASPKKSWNGYQFNPDDVEIVWRV